MITAVTPKGRKVLIAQNKYHKQLHDIYIGTVWLSQWPNSNASTLEEALHLADTLIDKTALTEE